MIKNVLNSTIKTLIKAAAKIYFFYSTYITACQEDRREFISLRRKELKRLETRHEEITIKENEALQVTRKYLPVLEDLYKAYEAGDTW